MRQASTSLQEFDAVVVGTGIGGATIGFALARSGWRVAFCERGMGRGPSTIVGDYPEQARAAAPYAAAGDDRLSRAGRWTTSIDDASDTDVRSFVPFIGCGVGGSSALYGMAMERFAPADFEPRLGQTVRHAGRPAGAGWPIGFDTLQPFYDQAERLYRVRGTADPLRADRPQLLTPPALSSAAAGLASALSARGLHPYQLPAAAEFVEDCRSCQGYLCANACKNDSWRVALEPAMREHGAVLMDECEVISIRSSGRKVQALECIRRGRRLALHGRVVILAAGALSTPALLLRSASADWPAGLANGSGLVGRNLMRHLIDLYPVKVPEPQDFDNRRKELAFNDFYVHQGVKLGTVQSFGRLPPPALILRDLHEGLAARGRGWARPRRGLAAPLLRAHLERLVSTRLTLASIVEDSADPQNRVELAAGDTQRLAIRYRMADDDRHRVRLMRNLVRGALGQMSHGFIASAEDNQRIAHVCGTCRFGDDPRHSVLDINCRAHEVENLYIVDASFFPTSAGTNPSLTIAANALRVAAALTGHTQLADSAAES